LPLKEQPHQKGYPEDLEAYYRNKLVDLLHGADMDLRPEIIPQGNISIAGMLLERWEKLLPESDLFASFSNAKTR